MKKLPYLLLLAPVVLLGGCVHSPATTVAAATPADVVTVATGADVSQAPWPADPDSPPAESPTPADVPAETTAPTAADGGDPSTAAPATTRVATARATTRATTTAPKTAVAAPKTPAAAPPPPPKTTAAPTGPGTVTLKCFPAGDGTTRGSITWTNAGTFLVVLTVNGKTYTETFSTVGSGSGQGANVAERTPGHGSCSGSVNGILKNGSY